MSSIKVSFEDSIEKNVISTGKCLGCGTCVVVCPFGCLEYVDEKPRLVKECKICGICAQACPQYEWSSQKVENFVFGRERKPEEEFGIYRKLAITQAADNQILNVCQDGGAVTALLLFALKEGIIDGAIVTMKDQEKPVYPHPTLATTAKEILQSAGTKYFYSPNILALTEAIKQKKNNIAFVGTPCQIRAIRKMQIAGLKKYVASIKILIGLACSECFTYEGLMQNHIRKKMGINPNDVKKINIKGKMLVSLDSGTVSIPLAETKQYARQSCHFCPDFSSEFADISVGGLGLEHWTFTIVRTESGEELFSAAEKKGAIKIRSADEEVNAINLLRKLSLKKRQK
ncbi:MAG: Coenzyme F420 hydrogenase/dehydrogenase, beta subunit C-terminal domain [Candidatus Bathyarchaeota archaeon]|jgi:coenzyme F420 hydrogenase subunit beta|nr:Coenzyme F420 hydrogenase/dehydrogenase, beta subunit C-terminal domain [Candidatus Bathyarchaeota archaeon]